MGSDTLGTQSSLDQRSKVSALQKEYFSFVTTKDMIFPSAGNIRNLNFTIVSYLMVITIFNELTSENDILITLRISLFFSSLSF